MSAGDQHQVVFENGKRYTFSEVPGIPRQGRQPNHHAAIQKVSLRFGNAYLKGSAEDKAWLQSSIVPKDSSLVVKDVWERK